MKVVDENTRQEWLRKIEALQREFRDAANNPDDHSVTDYRKFAELITKAFG